MSRPVAKVKLIDGTSMQGFAHFVQAKVSYHLVGFEAARCPNRDCGSKPLSVAVLDDKCYCMDCGECIGTAEVKPGI